MAETRFMKTVLFGGYERSSVEKRFERMQTQICDLKNELRETKQLLSELQQGTSETDALESVLAAEREKLTQAQVQADTTAKKLKTAESDLAERDAELKALKERLASLEEELRDQSARLIGYESGNDAAALSQVFIAAQNSASQLVSNARAEAEALERNSQKLAKNVVAEANNTAKQLVYDAEVKAAQTTHDAEVRLNQMQTTSANIHASLLQDVEQLRGQVSSLQAAFSAFQQSGISALDQSAEMLETARSELLADGVPEFCEPLQIVLELPDAPQMEPVDHNYTEDPEEAAARQRQAEELARLKAMAEAIAKKKPADAAGETSDSPAPAESAAAPDLAALAQQAAALTAPKHEGAPDLAALAAQANALKQHK